MLVENAARDSITCPLIGNRQLAIGHHGRGRLAMPAVSATTLRNMEIRGHAIGVCSWSLHPHDMGELVARVRQLGLEHVQLALGPLLEADDATRDGELMLLRDSGIKLTAGMIGFPGEDYSTIASIRGTGGFVPDELWP